MGTSPKSGEADEEDGRGQHVPAVGAEQAAQPRGVVGVRVGLGGARLVAVGGELGHDAGEQQVVRRVGGEGARGRAVCLRRAGAGRRQLTTRSATAAALGRRVMRDDRGVAGRGRGGA